MRCCSMLKGAFALPAFHVCLMHAHSVCCKILLHADNPIHRIIIFSYVVNFERLVVHVKSIL